MNNVYLIPHDDGTYEACIAPAAPVENAALLVAEGDYPVKCYYYRLDLNGDSILESYTCANREELIHGLNCDGKACHTIRSLWDFDSYDGVTAEIWAIYNAARCRVYYLIELDEESRGVYTNLHPLLGDSVSSCDYSGRANDMLIRYVKEHGCRIEPKYNIEGDDSDYGSGIICVDTKDSENGVIANSIERLIGKVREWNYELLLDDGADKEERERFMEDAVMLDELEEVIGCRTGYPLGNLTVKELIAVLSQMPEDYRVTCCGAESYLYLFAKDKYITIDNERWLG